MYKLLIALLAAVGVYGLTVFFVPSEVVYEIQQNEVVEEVIKEEVDEIDALKQELEKINQELDTKEAKLLEDRALIDAELERLREARVSFQ